MRIATVSVTNLTNEGFGVAGVSIPARQTRRVRDLDLDSETVRARLEAGDIEIPGEAEVCGPILNVESFDSPSQPDSGGEAGEGADEAEGWLSKRLKGSE